MEFNELYETLKHRVYNTVLSYLQSAEDAEEITQDVFVEVFHKLADFKENAQVSTWVYRIAINKSLDFLRYKNRKKRFGFMSSLFNQESGELQFDKPEFVHPGIQLERKEQAAQLFKALNQLPENQKTAFILIYIEQLPYAEAAKVMDLSVKALESLVQRAKKTLRDKLVNFKN
ncbi:MAG: RNA polymerase subunit sigma-70 [Bacteroidetes bacterium B1(2017)]|nr:MAG: RNA polymerase subunit sigma-70 [Bacteroidetes bacterium B1(2017)]